MKKLKDLIYESSLYLMLLMFINLLITFTLFYLKISISIFHFPISIILTIGIYYLLRKKLNLHYVFKSILLSIGILLITTTLSTFIYDRSSDGNTYHKDAISNLKNGWNPVYESSKDFTDQYYENDMNYQMDIYTIWKDHYAKANWVMEANIYAVTNNIESAKCINMIWMYILFGISLCYFSSKINLVKSVFLSLLISINPITSAQVFTFYNDQLGLTILFTLIISLISIIDQSDERGNFEKFFIMSIPFVIALNIKFNIMGYALLFTFIFMLKYLYDIFKNQRKDFINILKKLVTLFIVLFTTSLIYLGYSTYITNFIDHGNPFFPVYGEDKEDIITAQQPEEFLNYNNAQKVFYATFSKVNNLMDDRTPQLKIPFMVYKDEIKTTASIDTRISGFGIFFSGILILAIAIIILGFKKLTKTEKEIIILLTVITIGITFGISEGWWARYNPTLYLIPLMAFYLLLKYTNKLSILFMVILSINTLLILTINTGYTVMESIKINKCLFGLKGKEIYYNLNYGEPIGVLSNLDDFHIKYHYTDDNLENQIYFKYFNYQEIQK